MKSIWRCFVSTKKLRITECAAAVYTALIFAVSLLPGRVIEGASLFNDKVLHAGMFAVLGLLLVKPERSFHFLKVFLFISLIAAASEYAQRWVPGREADLYDWLADAAGGLCAFGAGRGAAGILRRRRGEKRR